MNCVEAEMYVLTLYDGEGVPPDAAEHIATCDACRRILNDYSKMGAELRLVAAVQPAQLPPLLLPLRRNAFHFLWARVAVPRFALAGLAACVALAMIAASMVLAQTRPLWFEFGYGLQKDSQFNYKVAQRGYDDNGAIAGFANGAPLGAAVHVQVDSISTDDVVLRIRAVPPKLEVTPTGFRLLADPDRRISLNGVSAIHYRPGESLSVPIEGGGTLYLKGEVLDHQPKIAFGVPLEPSAGEMVVRSPILTAQDRLMGQLNGATSVAQSNDAINFRPGSDGTFLFALKPFPGAVKGLANWGEITFKLEGRDYRLLAAAPITGGDQPRPVWVRHDAESSGESAGASLGTNRIPE